MADEGGGTSLSKIKNQKLQMQQQQMLEQEQLKAQYEAQQMQQQRQFIQQNQMMQSNQINQQENKKKEEVTKIEKKEDPEIVKGTFDFGISKSFFGKKLKGNTNLKLAIIVTLLFIILNSRIIWTQLQKLPFMGTLEPSIFALLINSILSGIIFYIIIGIV